MQKFTAQQEKLGTLIEIQIWANSQEKAFSAMDLAFLEAQRIEKNSQDFGKITSWQKYVKIPPKKSL